MAEAALQKCPQCNRKKLKRLISAGGGLIFKGPGFYATDYRKPNYNYSKKKGLQQEGSSPCSKCDVASSKCPAKKEG